MDKNNAHIDIKIIKCINIEDTWFQLIIDKSNTVIVFHHKELTKALKAINWTLNDLTANLPVIAEIGKDFELNFKPIK